MADNPSTQAQHLTDLTVGIQDVLDNLQKIREETNTTAEYIRSTMEGSLTGITGSSNGVLGDDAEKQEKVVEVTVNQVRKLIEQYAKAKKQIDDLAMSTSGLSNKYSIYRKEIDENIERLLNFIGTEKDANVKLKDTENLINETTGALQEYNTAISLIKSSLEEGGKSQQEFVDKLKDLQNKLINLSTQAGKKGFEDISAIFRDLSENAKNLIENVGEEGVTEKLQVEFRELKTSVLDTTIAYSELINKQEELKRSQPKQEPIIDVSKTTKEIDKLITSYANFQNTLSRSKLDDAIGTPLANIKNRAASARTELEQISRTIAESGTVTKEQAQRIQELSSTLNNLERELKDADTQARETGTGFKQIGEGAKAAGGFVADFISKLSDKAKWLVAFQFITLIQNSFRQVVSTIKDTEDAVIELQRVLNDDTLANSTIADKLYDIAYRYGQTFENVQETAVLFAQTGKSWNEVLQATEATMLGLNTAELEVTTATQGLIAVMSQFKIPASDLQEIIDKINITADNFPVTSEKIVAALQRAGSAAYNYGLTLEETIAIITALSEATGRAGANLGTALNSLINFTMKASSLEKFSEYLGGLDLSGLNVLEVWTLLGNSIKDGGEELAKLMAESKEFADLFSEEMADTVGAMDEYTAAVQNAEDVYSTAGVYRKNYFIALLNNIDTVTDALQNMGKAEGYSVEENKKYMETLTSQWNQLVVAAQELAVQFGEVGFLDFVKVVVQASTGVLKLTKDLGGLKTILIILLSLILQIKKVAVIDRLTSFANGIKNFGGQLKTLAYVITNLGSVTATYNMLLDAGKTKTEALTIATEGLKLSAGGVTAAIGLVVGAFSLVSNKINEAKKEAEEYRKEMVALGDEANEKSLALYNAYKNLKTPETEEDYKKSQEELLNLLGYQIEDLAVLTKRYGTVDEALKSLIHTQWEYLRNQAEIAYTNALEQYKDIDIPKSPSLYNYESLEGWRQAYDILKDYNDELEITAEITQGHITGFRFEALNEGAKNIDDAKNKVEKLNIAIGYLNESFTSKERGQNEYYQAIVKLKEAYENWINTVEIAEERIKLYGDSEEEWAENIANAKKQLDNATEAVNNFSNAMDSFGSKIDEINSKMDSFQSAYKTLESTIEEYNKTGILTADMMQDLLKLDPQYLEMLELKNGKLELNKEKVDELIAVNDDYMTQLAALSIAEAYNTELKNAQAAANAGLTLSDYKLKYATADLNSDIYKLALQFVKGEVSSQDFKSGITKAAEAAGVASQDIETLTNSVYSYGEAVNYINNLGGFKPFNQQAAIDKNLLTKRYVEEQIGETLRDWKVGTETWDEYQSYLKNQLTSKNRGGYWFTDDTTKKSSGTKKTAKELFEQQLKDMKTEYQKWLKLLEGDLYLAQEQNAPVDVIVNIYKKMQQEIHEAANKYRDLGLEDNNEYIIELKKQWWKYQDEIDKLYANDYNKFKEEQENKLSLLKNQYNVLESNLEEIGKSTNLQEQADTYKKIMEAAHNEAERLRADGVEKNKDAIQKAIDDWWKAYDSWKEINNKIATNVFDSFEDIIFLADSLNVWDKLDFTKVDLLKDKLEAINNLFKEGKLEASDYKDALKDVGIALYNAEIERLKKLGEDAETQNKADVEAINKNIEAIKTLKKNSDDYYDGLIDNLKQVQEENQRVNDQLEYQNNRQKIITNLEQARARSGIEYRQKEMEYQQQLVDLDEEWRKKQEELNLTDQMEQLEALKKQAAEDFEKSIEQLNEQITRLNTGLESTLEGLDKQAEELGKKIFDAINTGTKENLSEVGNQILFALDESQSPIKQKASVIGIDISNSMFGTQLENAAMTSATNVLNIFKTAFINPMDSAITQLMSKIMIPTSKDILSLGYGPINPNRVANNNSIIMYNNIPNVSAANSTIRGAQDIVNLNTNPSRF